MIDWASARRCQTTTPEKGNNMLSTLLIALLILLLTGALSAWPPAACRSYARHGALSAALIMGALIMGLILSQIGDAAAVQHSAVTDSAKAAYPASPQDYSFGLKSERRSRATDGWQVAMDWDRVEGNWKQFEGKIRQQWGRLTDNDLEKAAGRRERLEGLIQERYGIAKDEARKQVDEWLSTQRWQD
jgi:uncharacterized protein YjbJ (UPF0337 family)